MIHQPYSIRDGAQIMADGKECAPSDGLCICACSPAPTRVADASAA